MGTSQSQYRPHSHQNYNTYLGPAWGQTHNATPTVGNGQIHHHNHHHARAGFGFGAPRPHLLYCQHMYLIKKIIKI
ncbi:unnamed protein product [Adineta steineri]|uniref:Uncharacterized protein n=2 Tax=Adineta steineri TaxID=433720 RepID=A0A819DUC8_9BILA|nr:unnamed protein product [Adineta steineri]CAF3837435.1 unnamed protein product [Adineta steineri]